MLSFDQESVDSTCEPINYCHNVSILILRYRVFVTNWSHYINCHTCEWVGRRYVLPSSCTSLWRISSPLTSVTSVGIHCTGHAHLRPVIPQSWHPKHLIYCWVTRPWIVMTHPHGFIFGIRSTGTRRICPILFFWILSEIQVNATLT